MVHRIPLGTYRNSVPVEFHRKINIFQTSFSPHPLQAYPSLVACRDVLRVLAPGSLYFAPLSYYYIFLLLTGLEYCLSSLAGFVYQSHQLFLCQILVNFSSPFLLHLIFNAMD
jgi:hypothetical protein